jgi:hypothetical protein
LQKKIELGPESHERVIDQLWLTVLSSAFKRFGIILTPSAQQFFKDSRYHLRALIIITNHFSFNFTHDREIGIQLGYVKLAAYIALKSNGLLMKFKE